MAKIWCSMKIWIECHSCWFRLIVFTGISLQSLLFLLFWLSNSLILPSDYLIQIMGCRSYAELAVKPNMASSPKVVMSFLLEMSKMVRTQSEEVLNINSCEAYFVGQKGVNWKKVFIFPYNLRSSSYLQNSREKNVVKVMEI